jgi:hypothetical protein
VKSEVNGGMVTYGGDGDKSNFVSVGESRGVEEGEEEKRREERKKGGEVCLARKSSTLISLD